MSDPPAYFITFTTYGTRLHGDDRGTVDRLHNEPDSLVLPPNPGRRAFSQQRLAHAPLTLDALQRPIVEDAIREICAYREWTLRAVHVRTNHVHVVAGAPAASETMLNRFKAWATRRLREAGLVETARRVWARHGSTRYLWTDRDVESAVFYVVELQGIELD